ncbi:MAG: 3-hydroxyacyl-CoA dehydrogenase family protein, partial [Mariprofundaceae bacterium]
HVDGALKRFGMPMGAIELADRVGLDICHHVGAHLSEAFEHQEAMPEWFDRMVADGLLGEKSGKGFFNYEKGKQGELNPDLGRYLPGVVSKEKEFDADMSATKSGVMSAVDIEDACLMPMLVEALRCLQESVVNDAEQLDAAFVYGIGFPPFHGGLLRYFAARESDALRQKIEALGLVAPDNMEVLHAFQ